MLTDSVSMIPFALLSGFLYCRDEEVIEVRITELAENGFCFRTAQKVNFIEKIELHFYEEQDKKFRVIAIDHPRPLEVSSDEFSYTYEVQVHGLDEVKREQPCISDAKSKISASTTMYSTAVQDLIQQYYHYIQLKMSGDDASLSEVYTGYPAHLDEQITKDFAKQKHAWLRETFDMHMEEKDSDSKKIAGIDSYKNLEHPLLEDCELAIQLDHSTYYEKYLNHPIADFMKMYWEENTFSNHWLSKKRVTRLYIGNEFCHNLFPNWNQLICMLEKARSEGLDVTISFTYLREELLSQTEQGINQLYDWCKKMNFPIELVINDWGMLPLIQKKTDLFTPVLGVLLNKRRKDPRIKYKAKCDKELEQFMCNSLNNDFYQENLQEKYGMNRYEYESCGYPIEIPKGRHSLHIPFYQTNTSQYCPLYARCKEGRRGKQRFVNGCSEYCSEYVFSYPDHLHMVGRFNSLFGYDTEILGVNSLLPYYVEHGIDRIVMNFM